MLKYSIESFTERLPDLVDMFEDHYQEIGDDPSKLQLNPDYEAYFKLEDAGMLHLVIARDGEEVVGYYLSILAPLLHFKQVLNAYNDALYLKKDYRKGSAAYKMLKFAEKDLKDLGVDKMTIHTKDAHPFDKLCVKMGMRLIERHYMKYLGD